MKKKHSKNKGQFSIIAALLVAIVLVTVLITTYAIVRNSPFDTPPKVLGSIDEMNLALKKTLEFTVGYYGSILQVTGNVTYAKSQATNYLYSGLSYIANTHPEWSPSFIFNYSDVNTNWFGPKSRSGGNLSVAYSLQGMGITNIKYSTSCELSVEILFANATQTRIKVAKEDGAPVLTLARENFNFYSYDYAKSTWNTVNPASILIFSNGTYKMNIPSGVDASAYMIQVVDTRGIMVSASRVSYYNYALSWNTTYYAPLNNEVIVVEALQNGTLRWLGQNMTVQGTTKARPIPPVPIKSLRVNQTINGINREVAFQVEDWGSGYRVPLGLSSNMSMFSNRNMLVFLLNHPAKNITNIRLWWDGRDSAVQTTYAITNRYFTNDDPSNGILTNGILTLRIGKGIEHLYVNNYDGTYNNWSTNGSSPYLHDDSISYVFSSGTLLQGQTRFGYDTYGTTSASTENYMRGYRATCVYGGNATSITVWLYVSTAQKRFRCAIYSTSYNLIAQTQERTLAAGTNGWMTFNFTAPYPQLSAGTDYWLTVWGESASGSGSCYYDSGSSNVGLSQSVTYNPSGFPGTISPTLESRKYSIYCTYNYATVGGNEGWFGFADAYDTSGSVTSVKVEFEGKSDGDDYFSFSINDGSSTYGPYDITGLSTSYGWKSYNVSSILNTWTKINNAKLYVTYKKQGAVSSAVYLRRARLVVETGLSGFVITSTLGTSSARAEFMRINNKNAYYGSGQAYTIHHGIVRDIVQQEAEYQSGGISGCPNLYVQLVVMLPANATYYTYALRTIFINSSQSRTITDLSILQLYISCANSMWGSGTGQTRAENGTIGGLPNSQTISSTTRLFYNFSSASTGWMHHWSEFVKNNRGAGVMFINVSNVKLYAFDKIATSKTGALNVTDSTSGEYQNVRIEINPVERYSASFQYPLDVTWCGAVVNFDGTDPIYPNSGNNGLWTLVEKPPIVTIS